VKIAGRIETLSEGGALFTARAEIPEGEHAELRFPEPIASRIVMLRVTCRWSAPAGERLAAGLEFSASPSPPAELFRTFVARARGRAHP
jgi:hypothetical protein